MKKAALVLALLCSIPGAAQLWSGVLASSRAVDWSGVGVPGGIPSATYTQCGATIAAGATAATINTAIKNCGSNQYVLLGVGTFNFTNTATGGIDFSSGQTTTKSNVVLRGSGPDKTFLTFGTGVSTNCTSPAGAAICMSGSSFVWVGSSVTVHNFLGASSGTPTSGTYTQGGTKWLFDSVTGWSVGQLLIVDQLNDNNNPTDVIVNMSSSAETGDTSPFVSQEGGAPGRDGTANGCTKNSTCRAQQQFVKVTAINGNVLTVTPGLYMQNWRTSQTPQGWSPGVIGTDIANMIGVENLSVDTSSDGSASDSNISISNCYACWIKNVRSVRANRNHFWFYQAAHGEVRDSYAFGTKNAASQSYGVEYFMGSDNLAINNVFQTIVSPIMPGNTEGSVAAYNFSIDQYRGGGTNYWQDGSVNPHDAGVGMVLWEGNDWTSYVNDDIHGSVDFSTAFRNRFAGIAPAKTGQTSPVTIMAYGRFDNMIGNVLGMPGYHTNYQTAAASATDGGNGSADNSVYVLGFSGTEGACWQGTTTCTTLLNDTLVATTVMRWGNWDPINGTRFNSAEVPSAMVGGNLPNYDNPVPSSQTLPASFFLSSKPSWWGVLGQSVIPWPATGPDVTGGNLGVCTGGTYQYAQCTSNTQCTGTGGGTCSKSGYANANPAALCYWTVMAGSMNGGLGGTTPLTFNANSCYAGTAASKRTIGSGHHLGGGRKVD